MSDENKGYLFELINRNTKTCVDKLFLNPKIMYIPEIAHKEVSLLVNALKSKESIDGATFVLALTNKNNGVSVDKDIDSIDDLLDIDASSQVVKDLINIVRGYDMDEETNVCGW